MVSWKRVLLVIALPALTYIYSPVKDHIVSHYALRWYIEQSASNRSVQVRIHNLSSNASLPISLRAEYPKSKLIDFEYSDPWNGPRISSLKIARHSGLLRQFDLSLKQQLLLDEHIIPSSLEEIESELQGAVLTRNPSLRKTSVSSQPMTFEKHLEWLAHCRNPQSAYPCDVERAWENWEYLLRGIQGDETAMWKELAGIQLGFPDFHIVPEDQMSYIFAVAPGHSVSFFLQYGFNRVDGKIDVSTTDGPVLRVNKEVDLDRPIWMMMLLYPLVDPFYGLLVVALALAAIPLWAPLRLLRTSTIVNQALAKVDQMDTAKEWDEVYGRIKFSIKDKFDYYRNLLADSPEHLSSEELFDYLRGYLRVVYRSGKGRFRDDGQLENLINRCLLELAAK
jgi:hypothetical protein